MKRKTRWIVVAALAALTAAAAFLATSRRGAPDPVDAVETAVAVSVVHPVQAPAVRTVQYLGKLEGTDDAALSFRVGGTIGRVLVAEGQRVAAGQVVAELYQPEVAARLERARMEHARAEANLLHWQNELAIDERLLEQGAIARSRRDQTRLSYENARHMRDIAAAGVEEASGQASALRLRAPVPGLVTRIEHTAGETVMPGQPVAMLSAGPRRVRVDVLERDLAQGIGEGAEAALRAPGCANAARARVMEIEHIVRPPLQSVRAYLEAPSACLADLPAGTNVEATFHLPEAEEATLVPVSAVDLRAGSPRVFRIGPGEVAEPVAVELGLQQGALQQVRGPVDAADRIVVSGTTNLQPGTRVRVAAGETEPEGGAL